MIKPIKLINEDKESKEDYVKHNHPLLENKFLRILISGRSGSGKTRSLLNILPSLNKPDMLILTGPESTLSTTTYKSIKQHYKDNDTKVKEFNNPYEVKPYLTPQRCKEFNHIIVIIDDIQDKKELESLKFLFTEGRHLRITPILLSQSLFTVPPDIRKNITHLNLFHVSHNITQLYTSLKDVFQSRNHFDRLYNSICKNYNYITIDYMIPEDQLRIRKNFTLINKKTLDNLVND